MGALNSKYRNQSVLPDSPRAPEPDLAGFRTEIQPILTETCVKCHGADKQKADFRVDTLDPDLFHGNDVAWWLEVSDVITNGEMPPDDEEEMPGEHRSKVIEWLSSEIQGASQARRSAQGHSSFRRLTRYEYNYALQDLLGLPFDFAKNLLPDPVSEDGFQNSSEMLQMSASQYATYFDLNREALIRATVRGERPAMLYWGISADQAATRVVKTVQQLDAEIRESALRNGEKIEVEEEEVAQQVPPPSPPQKETVAKVPTPQAQPQPQPQPAARSGRGGRDGPRAHYLNTATGKTTPATWTFRRATHAWSPSATPPAMPERSNHIAVVPTGQGIVVELGNRVPDEGILRVRFRAWRGSTAPDQVPTAALDFGWQGNNNSRGAVRISAHDLEIHATSDSPQFYQWDIPLSEIYPRNPVRKTVELGTPKRTNPSEYIQLQNTSVSPAADLHFDYVEVSTPVYEQWPPASHQTIFIPSENRDDETAYAREIIARFMSRAWRRSVSDEEVDRKVRFFSRIRPACDDFQDAVIEVLATVLSSPRFLYLVQTDPSPSGSDRTLDEFELATRLAMFLWCSAPDDELLQLAATGQLDQPDQLVRQTKRLLADPRHARFSKHFVRQWLDLELLDYLNIDASTYPQFDPALKDAMQQEPIAFFEEVLRTNGSVMDFIHADYALVNQRLAQHYGLRDISGMNFRKVALTPEDHRGGLLTQAGLLAMNSDGKDSHPLKRGIWVLESLLNDPPPPPPPAVPQIDLADPEIAKLTLKERIENHRNDPACYSCHTKIDPWGIALENFDAVGNWRTEQQGREIDASSLLFNKHELDGIEGLKRYLLTHRQDQFARAMAYKLTTFALGRPLTFADRASVDHLTADLRKNGDGLATLITLITTSDIFRSR